MTVLLHANHLSPPEMRLVVCCLSISIGLYLCQTSPHRYAYISVESKRLRQMGWEYQTLLTSVPWKEVGR